MTVKIRWYQIILSNMTLASNRALTLNSSEIETKYRTSITSQNIPLEPSLNVPKIFRRHSCLDHHLVAPIKFNHSEYQDHVFGLSAFSTCLFANIIPERTLQPFELIQIEIWMHD